MRLVGLGGGCESRGHKFSRDGSFRAQVVSWSNNLILAGHL
jgi:hypothetical protein